MAKKYVYFVAYAHRCGWGNIEITQSVPLTEMDHIKGIQKIIAEGGASDPLVVNYQLLREAE